MLQQHTEQDFAAQPGRRARRRRGLPWHGQARGREARLARTRKDAAFGPASAASRRTPQREQAVAQEATVLALHDSIGNQRRIGHQPAFEIGPTLRRVDRARRQLGLPQHLRQRPGGGEDFGEGRLAPGADQRVRVLAGWQAGKAQAAAGLQ